MRNLTYYSDAEVREEELLQKVARLEEEILKLQKEILKLQKENAAKGTSI